MVPSAAAYTTAVHRKRKAENQRRDTSATKRFMPVELIRNHEETTGDSTLTTQTTQCSSWEYDNTSTTKTTAVIGTTMIGTTTHNFRAVDRSSSQLGDSPSNDYPAQSGVIVDYTGPATDLGLSRNSRILATMVGDAYNPWRGESVHTGTIGQPQQHHDDYYGQSQFPRDGRTLPADGEDGNDWGWFVYAEEDQLTYINGGHNGAR